MLHARSVYFLEPVFVHMKQIPDSSEKNDDKLYFFFREKSLDSGGGASPSVLARVGRVCLVSNVLLYVNQKQQVHRKQFRVLSVNKQLFVFHHRMMRADRSLLWTNGRLFLRPGLCAQWWEMMGWKLSLMNWVSASLFTSSFTVCIVPSSGGKCNSAIANGCWFSIDAYLISEYWHIFLMLCFSIPGDVFIQPIQDERNPVVYGVFSTSGYTPAFSLIHYL